MHLAADDDSGLNRSACGHLAVEVTAEAGRVTCRLCQRMMRKEREAIPDYVDDRWFMEQTRSPLPQSGLSKHQARVWQHALDGCARAVVDAAERRAQLRPPRSAPFSSVSEAIARMVVTRLDGYTETSVGDPERIRKMTGQLGSTPSVGLRASRAEGQADLAIEAGRALEHAFEADWTVPPVRAELCREMMVLRFAGGRDHEQVAEDMLRLRGLEVTAKHVAQITRAGFRRCWEWMVERGLIATASGRVVEVDEMKESSCAATDADLSGWDEIATFLGESRSTAIRWAQTKEMPVRKIFGRTEASSAELREWRARQTVRPPAK